MKVENMESKGAVANQFIIRMDDCVVFQSYDSIIAVKFFDGRKTLLDERYWDYSSTTGKYRNKFLNETIDETRKKIKSGKYILADLQDILTGFKAVSPCLGEKPTAMEAVSELRGALEEAVEQLRQASKMFVDDEAWQNAIRDAESAIERSKHAS